MTTRIWEVTFNRKTYFDANQSWEVVASNAKEAISKAINAARKDVEFNKQNLHTIESVTLKAEA